MPTPVQQGAWHRPGRFFRGPVQGQREPNDQATSHSCACISQGNDAKPRSRLSALYQKCSKNGYVFQNPRPR